MTKVVATFISTRGDYLEAIGEIAGKLLHVMDEFGGSSLIPGQQIEIEFLPFVDLPEEWEEIFSGNPERHQELVGLDGWRYKALGKVIAVDPVVCDCGLIQVEDPLLYSRSAVHWRICRFHNRKIGREVAMKFLRVCAMNVDNGFYLDSLVKTWMAKKKYYEGFGFDLAALF